MCSSERGSVFAVWAVQFLPQMFQTFVLMHCDTTSWPYCPPPPPPPTPAPEKWHQSYVIGCQVRGGVCSVSVTLGLCVGPSRLKCSVAVSAGLNNDQSGEQTASYPGESGFQ